MGLQDLIFARILTFENGLGAAVLGSQELKEYLVNFTSIYPAGLFHTWLQQSQRTEFGNDKENIEVFAKTLFISIRKEYGTETIVRTQ
jgi:hypothetical protein